MKSVSGEVVSCETFPLSRAARVLSNFVAADNGASPAFAAYLRRASASFNELAQLHKEHKRSGSQTKVKKQHSHGTVTEGTFESVINSSKHGLLAKELGRIDVSLRVDEEMRKHKSKNSRDEDGGRCNAGSSAVSMEVQRVEEVVDGNVGDVRGAGKKSKKKKLNNDTVAVTIKDQPYGDHAVVNAIEVKNEIENLDGSKEKKKKKKRVKHEKEESDDPVDKVKEMQSYPSSQDGVSKEATRIVENDDEQKKRKKKKNKNEIKEESISNGVKGEEQRDESKRDYESVENVVKGSEEKKHKKKRTHEGKERENEVKIEIESTNSKESRKRRTHEGKEKGNEVKIEMELANNKESRKRKHESVAVREFEGSQEKHKSKKKKR